MSSSTAASSNSSSSSYLEKQQSKLRKTVLGELQFMLHHFKQMLKSYEKGNSPLMIAGNHSRLSSFIPHLQQTIDQLHEPLASEEALATLERHLEKTLLPVKRRLEAQLKQSLPSLSVGDREEEEDDDDRSDADDDDERTKKRKSEEAEALGCISDFFGDVAIVEDPATKRRRHRNQRQTQYEDNVVTSEGSSSGTASDSSDSNSSCRGEKPKMSAALGGDTSSPAPPTQVRSAPAISSTEGGRQSSAKSSSSAPLRRRASTQVLPERVEYHCSCCGETYTARSSTIYNPWWSLVRQACPKCDQSQFPWIDISSATNQITHRPALPDATDSGEFNAQQQQQGERAAESEGEDEANKPGVDVEMESDDDDDAAMVAEDEDEEQEAFLLLSEKDHLMSSATVAADEDDEDEADAVRLSGFLPPPPPFSPVDYDECRFADDEEVGSTSDRLSKRQASTLLGLFHHARDCPGHHRSSRHAKLCTSTKYVMLHARDCRGTLPCGSPCPFEWCSAVKRLLAHVVRCSQHSSVVPCEVCGADARRRVHKLQYSLDSSHKQYTKPIPRIVIRKKDERRRSAMVIKRDFALPSSSEETISAKKKRERRLQRPSFDYWESLINVIEPSADDADDEMITEPQSIVG